MKNKKGQSLIDMIFSMGIVMLVLTGVVILIVSTAKVKRLAFERQKAIELSQLLIDNKVLEIKNDPLGFWNVSHSGVPYPNESDPDFPNYFYNIGYSNCNNQACDITFTITWGDNQALSVKRFFSRQGT